MGILLTIEITELEGMYVAFYSQYNISFLTGKIVVITDLVLLK